MKQLLHKSRHALQSLAPSKVLQSRLHRRVMMEFADKIGLVYFGYVDQRNDEHRLVRGATVSAHHRDNHYCIGTFQGYDLTLVERADTIHFPGKPARTHTWLIMAFDLHTTHDVPHVFVGLHTHSEAFYAHLFTKFPNFSKIPLGIQNGYDKTFSSKYTMYASPEHLQMAVYLIDPQITKIVADHFGALTFEVVDGTLYVYAEDQRPSNALLEKMLKYGVWLSAVIDKKMSV